MKDNISMSLGKRQLVDSIWKSTAVEGLGMTFPSTEAILNNLPVTTKRDEVYFVCNMKRAWELVFDCIDYPTTLMFLREINKICLDNLASGGGQLRNVPVSIGGTSWRPEMPEYSKIVDSLEKIQQNENKLEAALDMFCYIARAQMFIDGNKRVAQLICNKMMMEHDLGIFSIPIDEVHTFIDKLVDFYETNDSANLKQFFRDKCLLLTEKGKEELKGESNEHERCD